MLAPLIEFLKQHNLVPAMPVAATVAACTVGLALIGGEDAARVVAQAQPTTPAPIVVAQTQPAPAPIKPPAPTSFSPAQKKEIEAMIRDYLLSNPEVLAEAQQAFEAKQEAQRAELMKQAMSTLAPAIFKSASSPLAGNDKGDVTVVEFFDYNCGYCKRAMGDIARLIDSDKKVKFVFKELPIFGRDSEAAARVALAAHKQGKYFELHRAMLDFKGKVDEAKALELGQKLGLNVDQLKKDMAAAEVTKELTDTRQLAERLGIQGTPHFFIADRVVPGAPENLHDVLAQNIAEVRKAGGCKVC